MGRTTKSNQHTRRRTPCSKQEASQVIGPSPAAKTEETHQMNGNMEEKIKKLAGDALMPEQVAQMVDLFNRTMDEMIQAQADSYRAFHNAVAGEVEEYRKCSRSFIIHNVDKWVAGDLDTSGFPLADRATAAIHKMTKNMVTVTETYTIRRDDNKAPTSVYVTLGSQQQKKTFWRCLAAHTTASPEAKKKTNSISVRDAFPKAKMKEARELVQRGIELRKMSRIAAYRVVSSGPECTPVLETKLFNDKGRPGFWGAYQP
jgi:hypothetical protein